MAYKSLDQYANARVSDKFHDAFLEAEKALRENDVSKAAIAVGKMDAIFELLWQYKEILTEKLKE